MIISIDAPMKFYSLFFIIVNVICQYFIDLPFFHDPHSPTGKTIAARAVDFAVICERTSAVTDRVPTEQPSASSHWWNYLNSNN